MAASSPGRAVACSDAADWFNGDVTWIHAPIAVEVGGDSVVRVQVVEVETPGWPDPVEVLVCHPNLPVSPTPSLPTTDCDELGLVETDAAWGNIWDDILPGYGSGSVGVSNPYRNQYFRGAFDGDAEVLRALAIQSAAPTCGARMLAPSDYVSTRILDNAGVGLSTYLEDWEVVAVPAAGATNGAWWVSVSPSGNVSEPRPEHLMHGSYEAGAWVADTPGFTLPTDGLASNVRLSRLIETGATIPYSRHRELGPVVSSRVAYGRGAWDSLWHGTCNGGTDDGAWCLPDGHRRVGLDGILDATTCAAGGGACGLACPSTGAANEVKYDFAPLLDFVDDAWGDSGVLALPMGDATVHEDVHLAQRAALRVMPYHFDRVDDVWREPPSFLNTSCGLTPTTITLDGQSVSWYEADAATYQAQVGKLMSALGAATSGHRDVASRHAGFAGLKSDERVLSLDVGMVGLDGEWTVKPSTGVYLGDHADACYDAGPDPDVYALPSTTPPWWANILGGVNAVFPESTSDLHLIGKVLYNESMAATVPGQLASEENTCWALNEYTVGRRGTAIEVDSVEGGYTGQQNGVRYDSWGTQELRLKWWDASDANGREAAYAQESGAWEVASYQGEIWENMTELLSSVRSELKQDVNDADYGYWDLDELVRFAVAHRFSVFQWKRQPTIPYAEVSLNLGAAAQRLSNDWCDCAPAPDTPCVAEALERLLTDTGHRLRLMTRAFRANQDADTPMTLRLWFRNEGNVPALLPYQLEVAFVDEAAFDPTDPSDREEEPTWPRPQFGPLSGDVDALLENHVAFTVGSGAGQVDVREVAAPIAINPDVWADSETTTSYGGTTTCEAERFSDRTLLGEIHSTGIDAAATYPGASGPYPAYCAYLPLACQLAPSVGRGVAKMFQVSVTTPDPTSATTYVLLYRLKDVSTAVAGKQVHYDLPHAWQVGDGSSQRWGYLGKVTVTP